MKRITLHVFCGSLLLAGLAFPAFPAKIEIPDTTTIDSLTGTKNPVSAKSTTALSTPPDTTKASLALKDSLDQVLLPDSLAKKTIPAPKEKIRLECSAGLSWNVLIVPEIDDWQDAVLARTNDTSVVRGTITPDRKFENFNNTFSPHLGMITRFPSDVRIGLDVEFFSLTKRTTYTAATQDSLGRHVESFEEQINLKGMPISLWICRPIPENVFSIQTFEKLYVGAGFFGLPWTKLSAQGHVQPSLGGTGYGFGYMIKLGVNRDIDSRWSYNAEIRYASSPIQSFETDGNRLSRQSLLLDNGGDFALDFGCLQFVLQFTLHKNDPTRENLQSPSSSPYGQSTPSF